MMEIRDKIKELLPILNAIANGKSIEQRVKFGIGARDIESLIWHPWDGSITVLFDDDSWQVRIASQPLEFWLACCPYHGPAWIVHFKKPKPECPECQIIYVRQTKPPVEPRES